MLSHSEISTYLDCQRKWKLAYKDGIKYTNQHFQFGEMAHRVLESGEIPDEMLYPELKEYFKIPSWKLYFETIQDNVTKTVGTDRILYRELRLEDDELDLVGVIDLVTYNDKSDKYTLFDYKFTSTPRSTTALKLDEKLILYALLFSRKPVESILFLSEPAVLSRIPHRKLPFLLQIALPSWMDVHSHPDCFPPSEYAETQREIYAASKSLCRHLQ